MTWQRQRSEEGPHALVQVPDEHVWPEAGCLGFGFGSLQRGVIPSAWLSGRIVGRMWPIWGPTTTHVGDV